MIIGIYGVLAYFLGLGIGFWLGCRRGLSNLKRKERPIITKFKTGDIVTYGMIALSDYVSPSDKNIKFKGIIVGATDALAHGIFYKIKDLDSDIERFIPEHYLSLNDSL